LGLLYAYWRRGCYWWGYGKLSRNENSFYDGGGGSGMKDGGWDWFTLLMRATDLVKLFFASAYQYDALYGNLSYAWNVYELSDKRNINCGLASFSYCKNVEISVDVDARRKTLLRTN